MKTIYLCKIWKDKSREITYLVWRLQGGNENFELKIEIVEFILPFTVQELTTEGEILEIWNMARGMEYIGSYISEIGNLQFKIKDWKLEICNLHFAIQGVKFLIYCLSDESRQ